MLIQPLALRVRREYGSGSRPEALAKGKELVKGTWEYTVGSSGLKYQI
jgi:hypothetical protein